MTETQTKKIGDVCDVVKGATGIMKAIPGKYPMPTLAEERNSHNEYQFDCNAVIIPLVSSTGHGHASIKRVHYQEGKFALGTILAAVMPRKDKYLHPKYLYIYLSYFKDELLVPLMSGAANVTLSIKSINSVEIIVPPYNKQLEIIKLEGALSRQKKSIEIKLSDQKIILQKLRQAILQDAISGKLTIEWRKKNPNVESASELLKKIKAEKEKLIVGKKIKKEKYLPEILKEEIPFELPKGWVWCRLREISMRIHYGFNASANHNKKEVRLLRITDIQNNQVKWENVPGCEFSKADLGRYLLSENDILIARTGGTIGKSYIVKNLSKKSLFASYLIRIIPSKEIDSAFLKLLIESPIYWKQLYAAAWGAGQPNVNATSLSKIVFPMPTLFEQKAIVAKVENLMQKLDKLEAEISQNQKTADQLMQAVLKEAFEQ